MTDQQRADLLGRIARNTEDAKVMPADKAREILDRIGCCFEQPFIAFGPKNEFSAGQ